MGRYVIFRQKVERALKARWASNGAVPAFVQTYPEQHYPDEPALGLPPNLGHDTDTHSADWADVVDKNTRALAVSLSGKLQRDDITVNGGHAHDDYLTELEWQNFGRWRPLGDNQGTGGPNASKGLLYVSSTTPTDAIVMMGHVPSYIKEVEVWVRVSQPAPGAGGTPNGWLWITVEGYDLNNAGFASLLFNKGFALQSVAAGMQHANVWLGPLVLDVTTLAFTVVRSQRWVAVKLVPFVSAGGTLGAVWEACIRRRSNGI